jgi:hypothetical protein
MVVSEQARKPPVRCGNQWLAKVGFVVFGCVGEGARDVRQIARGDHR